MPLSKVYKTLDFRRAMFLNPALNLETITRAAWAHFSTQIERTIKRSDGVSSCGTRVRDDGTAGIIIQCTRFIDRQGVGTISMLPAPALDIGTRAPGLNENFVNTGFMAMISGNNVICLDCGPHASSLAQFLKGLIKKAGLPDEQSMFDLTRPADPNKIRMIQRIGVSRIDLNAEMSEVAANTLLTNPNPTTMQTIVGGIGRTLNAIVRKDRDLMEIANGPESRVSLSLSFSKKDPVSVQQAAVKLAEDVIEEEEEGFTIHLADGKNTVKSNEVSIKQAIRVTRDANWISVTEGFQHLRKYRDKLEEDGYFAI